MQKEILTKENIISDLKSTLIKEIKTHIFTLPLMIFLYLLGFVIDDLHEKDFMLIFWMIFCAFLTLIYIYQLIRTIVLLCKIKDFTVSTDIVTKKLEKRRSTVHSILMPRPYMLVFSRKGKYRIPDIKNYKWSNMFDMPDENVFHCSNLNDDFYLISIGKRKNIVAYNKKMFEMK